MKKNRLKIANYVIVYQIIKNLSFPTKTKVSCKTVLQAKILCLKNIILIYETKLFIWKI